MLGLASKPNTAGGREWPAPKIAAGVRAEAGRGRAFDPVATETARAAGFNGEFGAEEYSTCTGADAVAIVTEWNQFRNLDLERLLAELARPVMVDMRNIYEPAEMERAGLRYDAVGR